jgi:DNA-binding response OmpR family regulator
VDNHARILIVDDDEDIQDLLFAELDDRGYIVDLAGDGSSGLQLIQDNEYDLVLLDINMPGMNGFAVCRELRDHLHVSVPILMLTLRSTVDERVEGLEAGADDYLCKPFEITELMARMRALLRRGRPKVGHVLRVADLELDLERKQASRAGQSIHLSPIHLKLLATLMRDSPNLVSRDTLATQIWGDEPPDSDALRAHIHTLRAAIDKPFDKALLQTVPKLGYRLG